MAEPLKIDGYIYNQEINAAVRANADARAALRRIINEDPSPALRNHFQSLVAAALAENLAALHNLSIIVVRAFPELKQGAPTRGDDRSASVARGAQPSK